MDNNSMPMDTQWDSEAPLTQFESINSAELRDDFLQHKGDSLLLQQSVDGTSSIQMTFSNSDESNGDWPADNDNFDGGFAASVMNSASKGPSSNSYSSSAGMDTQSATSDSNPSYTIVFNKRRAACVDCIGECSYYKGIGGPCNECGCYPARHVDLDAPPKPSNPLKRSASHAGLTEHRERKRPRFLLEAKFFQKLFFSCMQFMTLPEIARVANAAPIPIFVKDENSVYIYINPTFCHFITDLSRTERVLNHTTQQIFEPRDASEVVEHDKFLVQQGEGTLKTFDVSIKKQEFRVMKEYCALRDGKKVILGAVISSL
jgi:PAS domain-containing protein